MTAIRLILINLLIRIASAASGQLLAFLVADRLGVGAGSRAAAGSVVVGLLGVGFFVTELLCAPIAGRIADRRGQLQVLRWGPVFGIVSVLTESVAALAGIPRPGARCSAHRSPVERRR